MFILPEKLYKTQFNQKKNCQEQVDVDIGEVSSNLLNQAGSWENVLWAVASAADDWSHDTLMHPSQEEINKAQELRDGIMKLMSLAKDIDRLCDQS